MSERMYELRVQRPSGSDEVVHRSFDSNLTGRIDERTKAELDQLVRDAADRDGNRREPHRYVLQIWPADATYGEPLLRWTVPGEWR